MQTKPLVPGREGEVPWLDASQQVLWLRVDPLNQLSLVTPWHYRAADPLYAPVKPSLLGRVGSQVKAGHTAHSTATLPVPLFCSMEPWTARCRRQEWVLR